MNKSHFSTMETKQILRREIEIQSHLKYDYLILIITQASKYYPTLWLLL